MKKEIGGMRNYISKIREKGFRKSFRLLSKLILDVASRRYEKIRILWFRNILSDGPFFQRIDVRLGDLKEVRAALEEREFDRGKILFVDYLRKREVPRFFLNHEGRKGLLKIINEKYRGSKEATIRRANEICEHNFQFLVPDLRFADKVDWLSNLIDDRRWEIGYWRDIDIIGEKRIGDVRQIWELNRHQYFITLGKAYWYTGDEKYAKEFVSQMRDWIKNNPYGKSVNWVHAQEIALRVVSWIWAYYFFCNSPNFTVEDQIEFLKSLYLQTEFLRKHLSDTTFSTHNHIISETTGLGNDGHNVS